MKLSVVIISRNEGAELRRTLESLRATLPPRSEIVIVDDCSTDGSTRGLRRVIKANGIGVARARNLGVSKTTGDLLFFADAHIRLEKRWWQPLAEVLEDRQVAAVAPAVTHLPATRRRGFGLTFTGPDLDARWLPRQGVTPFSAPILPGCSLMMRRATFDAVGGWDSGLLHRGGVDNEMSVRLWLLGYELMVAPQVVVPHLFRSASPYPVGWPQYLHNRLAPRLRAPQRGAPGQSGQGPAQGAGLRRSHGTAGVGRYLGAPPRTARPPRAHRRLVLRKVRPQMVKDDFSPFKRHSGWFSQCACYPLRDAHPGQLEAYWKDRQNNGWQDQSLEWTCVGPKNIAGRVTSLVIDPADAKHLIAGSAAGGVWSSPDGGMTWQPAWPKWASQSIGALAFDAHDPKVLYCATGEANISPDCYPGQRPLREPR